MSKSSGQKDPSMDEILGSIRRIITEDNAQSGQPVKHAEETPGTPEDDDVLELTDVLGAEDEPESRREPTLQPVEPSVQDAGVDPLGVDPLEERREPVLGIHSPTAAPVTEEPAVAAPVEPVMAAEPPAGGETTLQEEVLDMATSDESGPPPVDPLQIGGEEIVSESTTSATAAALGELNKAMDEKAGRLRLGEGDATVSDIVKELVRPMLRDWIDQNLPTIVERVVRREIQKLVDRTPDDD